MVRLKLGTRVRLKVALCAKDYRAGTVVGSYLKGKLLAIAWDGDETFPDGVIVQRRRLVEI